MELSTKVTIPTQVMARTVGEETVILDLVSGTYYGLNPVGARMWQLLGQGASLAEVCEAMFSEYSVARETLEGDVLDLVEDLLDKKLVSLR